MAKPKLALQPSEMAVFRAAATIYSAYIMNGQVTPGEEKDWRNKSLQEAILLAQLTEHSIQSDEEMG